jgi:hypothetical protein
MTSVRFRARNAVRNARHAQAIPAKQRSWANCVRFPVVCALLPATVLCPVQVRIEHECRPVRVQNDHKHRPVRVRLAQRGEPDKPTPLLRRVGVQFIEPMIA